MIEARAIEAGAIEAAPYDDATAFAAGPQRVYERLAAAAVPALGPVQHRRVADVGAGTGSATRALLARGAQVTAIDLSTAMLRELCRQTNHRVGLLAGDARRLPIRDRAFDACVAAYVVNHLKDPAAGVAELARVTAVGGRVVATVAGTDEHPAKAVVNDVLQRNGYVAPAWYVEAKRDAARFADPDSLEAIGHAGGLAEVKVDVVEVDLGDLDADAIGSYRLGMPHITGFVASLPPAQRMRVTAEVVDAVAPLPPLRLTMMVLSGVRPGG
jgi:ubiquinone/menaquinone biosynthesis C-methylase UbiE